MTTVSVIIPAYNAAATIARTLSSVQEQTLSPLEIIVVDDGSNDETSSIVAHILAKDRRVRLIQQSNAGQIAARNRAIHLSSGALIAPIDADDIWHPSYLQQMAQSLDAAGEQAGFAYALYRVIDEKDNILFDGPNFQCDGWAIVRHLFVNFVGNGSCAVFRRGPILAVGGYPVEASAWRGAEDYLLQLRLAARYRVARVDAYLVGYRRTMTSYSRHLPEASHRARISALQLICAECGLRFENVIQWADAEGYRVAAAILARDGHYRRALRPALRAAVADPLAMLADILARFRNAASRLWHGPGTHHGPYFEINPSTSLQTAIDCFTLHRLRWLAAQEPGFCMRSSDHMGRV